MTTVGGELEAAFASHLNAGLLHQTARLTATNRESLGAQFLRHASAAVDAAGPLMNCFDPQHQILPLFTTALSAPLLIVVEAAGTDLQDPAQHADRIAGLLRLDELKFQLDSLAKKAAAS